MAELHCPVCGIRWPARLACCPCGFAPEQESLDGFVFQLRRRRRRGLLMQALGTCLCAVLPLVWLFGSGFEWIAPTLVGMGLEISGAIVLVRGTIMVHQTTRQLRAVTDLRQLPVARIVE